MKIIDDIVIDLCPLADKFEKPYKEKFITWTDIFTAETITCNYMLNEHEC